MKTQAACTVWFTGLSGSGKTTLARRLKRALSRRGHTAVILDGDEIRKTISKDLGFSKKDIAENHRRILELCKKHARAGTIVIVATISPHRAVRARARAQLPRFVEVYCNASLDTVRARDVKGHYKNVASGALRQFIGVHTPYEAPKDPELTLATHAEPPTISLKKILGFLETCDYI